MFAKLLKYEWRSSRKTIATLCAVILISGLLIGSTTFAMVRWDSLSSGSDVLAVIPVLLISLCIMAAAVSCAASVFYVLWRFYKSRFTEEGYLTYTLPVNNHFLILSSLLMSTLEILLVLLAAAAAVVLAMGIFSLSLPWKAIGPDTWNAAWRILGEMGNELGRHGKECFLFFMTLLLGGISTMILLMLSVTVGSIVAKKHPILMAVAVYYGIGILRGALSLAAFIGGGESGHGALTMMNASSLLTIGVGYALIYWLTSKKLNLN